jgi:hypothetical protein
MFRRIPDTCCGRHKRRFNALTAFFLTLASLTCAAATGEESVSWLIGTAYQRELRKPLSFDWTNSPIRDALMRLSKDINVAIFLDRRVDPDKRVDYRPKNVAPLSELLKDFAASQNLGVASVGSVVYIGPMDTAAKLPTLLKIRREELRKLPRTVSQRFARSHAEQWQALTTPRELLTRIEENYGVQTAGKELLPHDLWPAASLPEMSFTDKMTLLLAGFQLTYKIDSSGIRLMPIPERMTLVKVDGGRVIKRTVVPGDKRFTLNVENQPVGPLMKALAAKLDLELQVDKSAENSLGKLVSLNVKEATRDELLRAALNPAGLDFRLEGKSVIVFASE